MRIPGIASLCAAAALALTAAQAAGQKKPPAGWNGIVTQTPSGGHLMGSPSAKNKLVSYVSYTCGHCAQFDREATDPLRVFLVQRGKLSYEVRSLVRDPIDMTVAMLANCGPPSRFFANHTMFMRSQNRWLALGDRATEGQKKRWSNGNNTLRMRAIASDFGFFQMMENRGYSRIAAERCLADQAVARRLAGQTAEASTLGIDGTPAFMLNGEVLAGTHDWQTLQVQLNARL